jgi:hypothetical protein
MREPSPRIAARPWTVPVVVLAALALAVPSLTTGFCTDDHSFRALLHAGRPAYDLFRFAPGNPDANHALIARGALPWWSSLDLKIHFFRPLTGVLFFIDQHLFGDQPLGYHLDSVALYLALVTCVALFYRRLLGASSGTVAAAVFAFAPAHAGAYAWVSARHVLVAAVPVIMCLWCYVWARECGRRWLTALAAFFLCVGLSASEAALGGFAYLAAYEAMATRGDAPRKRLLRLAPAAVVIAAYAIVYRIGGYGVRASGGYHDPTSEPLTFAMLATTRGPVLVADALVGLPTALLNVMWPAPLVVVGLVAVALMAWLVYMNRAILRPAERSALRWLVPGSALSLIVVAGSGIPSGRLLVVPDVGLAALVGVLLRTGLSSWRAPRRAAVLAFSGLLVLLHFGVGPLLCLRETRSLERRARAAESAAEDVLREAGDARVMLVVASDPTVFLYAKGALADVAPRPVCWAALSAARGTKRLTRVADKAFSLEAFESPLLGGGFDAIFRPSDRPFSVGEEVEQCHAIVRVRGIRDGVPTRIDVDLSDLPMRAVALLVYRGGHLTREALPEVGESAWLPWEPGPTERYDGQYWANRDDRVRCSASPAP